jgi:hypothetical protein
MKKHTKDTLISTNALGSISDPIILDRKENEGKIIRHLATCKQSSFTTHCRLMIFLPTKGDDAKKVLINAIQGGNQDDNGKQVDMRVQVIQSNQIEKRMPK